MQINQCMYAMVLTCAGCNPPSTLKQTITSLWDRTAKGTDARPFFWFEWRNNFNQDIINIKFGKTCSAECWLW